MELLSTHQVGAVLGGFNRRRGNFQVRWLYPGQFLSTQTWSAGGSVPGPAQRRQQARKSSIPSGEESWREMLSLAAMKSTEPRRRAISEAAAVEVPTAVPWITSKMLAESTAETRYSLMEAGICNGKGDHGVSVPLSCRQGTGEGEDLAVLPADATSVPKHPSILPEAPATQASKPKTRKAPKNPRCSTARQGKSWCPPPRVPCHRSPLSS